MKYTNEAFNIRSKLINISELARRLNVLPTTLYNRINGLGRHKALNPTELINIEQIIKDDLFNNKEI